MAMGQPMVMVQAPKTAGVEVEGKEITVENPIQKEGYEPEADKT